MRVAASRSKSAGCQCKGPVGTVITLEIRRLHGLAVEGLFSGCVLLVPKRDQNSIGRDVGHVEKGFLPPQMVQGGLVL